MTYGPLTSDGRDADYGPRWTEWRHLTEAQREAWGRAVEGTPSSIHSSPAVYVGGVMYEDRHAGPCYSLADARGCWYLADQSVAMYGYESGLRSRHAVIAWT